MTILTKNISKFTFLDEKKKNFKDKGFAAIIPEEIPDLEHLFDIYTKELKLPSYFGRNWDALNELLHDLFWIKEKNIIITHRDLPVNLSDKELKIYLEILHDAITIWEESPRKGFTPPKIMHKLIVTFPDKYKETIKNILN